LPRTGSAGGCAAVVTTRRVILWPQPSADARTGSVRLFCGGFRRIPSHASGVCYEDGEGDVIEMLAAA
jgi:hypothetical protein